MKPLMKIAGHILLLMLLPLAAQAQVSVSLAPVPHMQFLSNSALPLANGCVFTYQGGTTNPAATYVDSTGTAQNTNPIILNAGGFADIWLPNAAFKFKVVSAGGVNCASGVTQWTVDNISGVLGLLNLPNTFTAANTFTQPITITPNANQIVAGAPGNQTTLNFPAPGGNIVLSTPTVTDTLAGVSANQTLSNKNLVSPTANTFIGPLSQNFNNIGPGTGLNLIVSINGAGVQTAPAAVNGVGLIGICVLGCAVGGQATVQTVGIASCVFDGGTTSGDYIQLSSTVNGNCHDTGSVTFPTGGQVIGRALSNQAIAGTYSMLLFGPEVRANPPAQAVNLTAQGANIASTPIFTPAVNGFYRFSCYVVVTQVATVSSTLPACLIQYNDADTNIAESVAVTQANAGNTLGLIGNAGGQFIGLFPFFAKGGVAISYSTTSYATNGATPMQYAIRIRVEGPF